MGRDYGEAKREREMKKKAQRDPRAQKAIQEERELARVERQRKTTERISLAEVQRKKIQEKLKREADEEAACKPKADKRARINEALDVLESTTQQPTIQKRKGPIAKTTRRDGPRARARKGDYH